MAVALGAGPVCFADTLQTFGVGGAFADPSLTSAPGSLWGTVVIDTTQGSVVSGDLTTVSHGATYSFHGAPGSQGGVSFTAGEPDQQYVDDYLATFGSLTLSFDIYKTLEGYTGGTLCAVNDPSMTSCIGPLNGYPPYTQLTMPGDSVFLDNGTAQLVTTPEPSTIALLGTGLLGAAGAARRRFRQ